MSEKFSSFSDLYDSGFLDLADNPEQEELPPTEKMSPRPDKVFAREVIASNPELATKINQALESLADNRKSLPFVHVTPTTIVDETGNPIGSTQNVESITNSGLRKMDTNVGAFILPGQIYPVNDPAKFIGQPDTFIRQYVSLLKHYSHHGRRLNHPGQTYAAKHPTTAAMILINGSISNFLEIITQDN